MWSEWKDGPELGALWKRSAFRSLPRTGDPVLQRERRALSAPCAGLA